MNGQTSWETQELLIPANHPSAAGHFPGNPIIPGALLLDAVVQAMGQSGSTIQSAKFLIPIRHGTRLQLRWQGSPKYRFECRTADDALVLSGILAAAPKNNHISGYR